VTSSRARIGALAGALLLGAGVVLAHLFSVMVIDHGAWAARSHRNRWTFRSVPSARGSVRDRTGAVLAYDEPTMEVALLYRRFRLRHPVGAAVHAATTWARLQPGREATAYSYLPGMLGPEAAAAAVLAMPAGIVAPGRYPKAVAAELTTLVTTVLAAAADMPRKRVFAALRTAAAADPATAVGDVLPGFPRTKLFGAWLGHLAALHGLEQELVAARRERPERLGLPVEQESILLGELELRREQSLKGLRVQRTDPAGKVLRDERGEPVSGDAYESIAWPFADHVPFELAAGLRAGAHQHPGIEVNPALQRVTVEPAGSALRGLLGTVQDLGTMPRGREAAMGHVVRELPADFVPDEAAASDDDYERLQQEAVASLNRAMLLQARAGASGVERAFDPALSGRLGLRLVERDAGAREHQLWSNLRVQSGDDVTLTLDLALQRVAERVVAETQRRMAGMHADPEDQERVRAGLAVIDANSGDVLAVAGAPVTGNDPRSVPGVSWFTNGDLGSIVKPFVLLEHLQAEAAGRAHRATATFAECSGSMQYGGRKLSCSGHWREGTDPVTALAKSCNLFFFQAALGLGEDGLRAAYRRFGLLRPAGSEDPAAVCWQEDVSGLPRVKPRWEDPELLPMRAIGYGAMASTLDVARAYAGIATGRLPTLGLRLGEARPNVPLPGLDLELEVVRAGLRGCVESGTARHVAVLADFQVHGKTGTAEVGARDKENNAWFAGYLPWAAAGGVQPCFCAVVYWVPHGVHGGEPAAQIAGDLLVALRSDLELAARYLQPGGGR